MSMKRLAVIALSLVLGLSALTACTTDKPGTPPDDPNVEGPDTPDTPSFDASKPITVVSREDGSGTRSAFIELFGVQSTEADGSKKDNTTKEAIIADKTDVMMTNVAGDPYAIGYISMGSLNDTIKPLSIDGVAPTIANVKDGSYPIQRPFIIATNGEADGLTKDFIDYIMSSDGQAIVEARGYIAVAAGAPAYAGSKPSGRIVVGGSSSVTPLMEKLREEYLLVNPNAEIEIQMFDSSAGMTGAIDGTFDIGMSSRELKDSELSAGLLPVEIALDGIAVIVNLDNPLSNATKEQVRGIYTGEVTIWSDIN
jgi:phosphate transport system substrate-binding protein